MSQVRSKLVFALAVLSFFASASALGQANQSCSARDLKGGYGFTIKGPNAGLNYILTGRFEADGVGSFNGSGHENFNYTAGETTFTGTYTIDPDCTGTALFQYAAGQQAHLYFVLVDDGNELIILDSDSGVMEAGSAKRQTKTKTRE